MHNHWGKIKMKGKLTKMLSCKCCVAFNGKHKILTGDKWLNDEIQCGVKEYKSELTYDLKQDHYFRSFFPQAREIICYEHYILGKTVVEVDGVFKGYMSDYDTLCSFIYFTCPSYRDIDDLETQYLDYLETNEKGDWLP